MENRVLNHPYLSENRIRGLQYIVVPKALLRSAQRLGLDLDDAIMYCVLRSRCDLSLRNKWLDSEGRVFIYYTREEMGKYMGWGGKKTIDGFRRLSAAGLITEQEMVGKYKNTAAKRIFVHLWEAPYDDSEPMPHGLSVEDIKAGALPYLRHDSVRNLNGSFYALPRLLLEHPIYKDLPLRAKLLYVIAMDQIGLSVEFGQFETQEDGQQIPYCYLDKHDLCAQLQCSERTLTTLYKALQDIGLMERKRVSFQPDLRILLRDFVPCENDENTPDSSGDTSAPQISHSESAKNESPARKIRTPDVQESNSEGAGNDRSAPQKSKASKPNPVKQVSKPFEVSLRPSGEVSGNEKMKVEEEIKAALEYPLLRKQLAQVCSPDTQLQAEIILDLAIDLLTRDVLFPGKSLWLGNDLVPKEDLMAEYRQLDRYILLTLIPKIAERTESIRNLPDYVHRSLFTAAAKHGGESYYIRCRVENLPSPPPPRKDEEKTAEKKTGDKPAPEKVDAETFAEDAQVCSVDYLKYL